MYPTLADSFIQNCAVFPQKNALFIDGVHYTYAQLLVKVHSIYTQIVNQEKKYDRIGVYCTDDLNTYASILAVSAYGAAFVPLNSNFPLTRNLTIIESASIELILNATTDTFQIANPICIPLSTDFIETPDGIEIYQFDRKTDQDLSYILFTSGSTGKPKGVPITNRNIAHFFEFFMIENRFHFTENDRFSQVFDLTFDVSIFSFFMPLYVGACCYVSPQKGIRYLEIVKLLNEHQITVATMVPTVLQYIEKYIQEINFPQLRYSFFIGDKLSHRIVSKWSEKIDKGEIYNFYGPTEATVVCSYYKWNEKDSLFESNKDIVPIGKPFTTIEIAIIDEENERVKENAIGELCLSGPQVISAYLNNTNENRFVYLKNAKGDLTKFYKTGDLVSLNTNDNLLFYGRIDNQVKINGHRIEINEIEETIRKLTDEVIHVVCFTNSKGIKHLVLFIEKNSANIDFKTELIPLLPEFMTPKTIIVVDQMPLNFNSKVDQRKLEEIYLAMNRNV